MVYILFLWDCSKTFANMHLVLNLQIWNNCEVLFVKICYYEHYNLSVQT